MITDWSMPRMDGIALVRAIVKAPDLDVPVLMVSGETYVTRFVEVIRAGAQGYLPKPFTADALRIKIAEIEKKLAMQREGAASSLRGQLAEVGFPELVQFVSSCSLTGRLIIQHTETGVPLHGLLEVRGGEVVAAYCGDATGDDAVYALAEWDDGTFRFQPDEREVQPNTTMPTLTLLVEAMKRRDEATIGKVAGSQ